MRSVGRSSIDGASTGTLSSARRSPNWRLPSIRTVRGPSWPSATARLNAIVVLPTPPLGAKTVIIRAEPVERSLVAASLRTCCEAGDELVAGERHRQHAVDALARVDGDRLLGHGEHDHRDARARLVELVDERQALDPALEQGVDEDDVGPQLLDQPGDRATRR